MKLTPNEALALDDLGKLSPEGYSDMVEKAIPDIFAQLYPRRILHPQNHYSGRIYAAINSPIVRDLVSRSAVTRPLQQTDLIVAVQALICMKYKVPTYHISKNLAEALWHSRVPLNTTGRELPRKRNTGVILLPRNFLFAPDGKAISYIAFSFITGEDREWLLSKHNLDQKNSELLIMSSAACEGQRLMYGLSVELDKTIQDINESNDVLVGTGINTDLLLPDETDTVFNRKCFNFLCNILFLMDSRPEILLDSKLERKGKEKKGKKTDDLWSPRYIGFDYKSPSEKTPPGDGSHASPRMHWRQGHWRNQPFGGKDAPQIKRIWIDTVLVSASI